VTAALEPVRFDVEAIRQQFPALHQRVNGKPLVYLDNAASAQVPVAVLDAMDHYYRNDRSNVHRGAHTLSRRATDAFEEVRARVARFIGAADPSEIVYVRGTTEAINLVAHTFGRSRLGPGDEVLVSTMEHHSNIVPWQIVCNQVGARVREVPIDDRGQLDLAAYSAMLGPRVKMVALAHVSNALGTVNPAAELVARAHAHGVPILLDGAQAVAHLDVDVAALGCDFYAFSGHKLYGPNGVGALYGRREHLDAMPPWHGGGEMIRDVSFEGTTFADPPFKFEAGTPDVSGVIGLGAAIDWFTSLDREAARAHERSLLAAATARIAEIDGVRLIGTAARKEAVLSFALGAHHPGDVGTLLDLDGVAVRTGHHCTQPLMRRFGVPGTVRASFALYNTHAEVDAFVGALRRAAHILE
jgi:cysteine desulfurase/selenocysteine lyase